MKFSKKIPSSAGYYWVLYENNPLAICKFFSEESLTLCAKDETILFGEKHPGFMIEEVDDNETRDMSPTDVLRKYDNIVWDLFKSFSCTHTSGIKRGYIEILKSKRGESDGETLAVIYYDRATLYTIYKPYNHSNWTEVDTKYYESASELDQIIQTFIQPNVAKCWK